VGVALGLLIAKRRNADFDLKKLVDLGERFSWAVREQRRFGVCPGLH
jgi:hypothetical protein